MKIKLALTHPSDEHIQEMYYWRDKKALYNYFNKKKINFGEYKCYVLNNKKNIVMGLDLFNRLEPIGHIELQEPINNLTINIKPNKRRKGYGTELLRMGISYFAKKYYVAKIYVGNHASIRIFEKNNFKLVSDDGIFKSYTLTGVNLDGT